MIGHAWFTGVTEISAGDAPGTFEVLRYIRGPFRSKVCASKRQTPFPGGLLLRRLRKGSWVRWAQTTATDPESILPKEY